MPFIPVPGVAQFKLTGSVGSGVWNCILHFLGTPPGGAYTVPQLTSMITGFANVGWAPLLTMWPSTTSMVSMTGIDLGTTTPAEYTGALGFTGTGIAEQDAAACMMINYSSAARFRGGKPRTYLPGVESTQQATPNTWSGAAVTQFNTSWRAAMSAMAAGGASAGVSGCVQCYVQYNYLVTDVPSKRKYLRTRESLKAITAVTGLAASAEIRTQRRRLRTG